MTLKAESDRVDEQAPTKQLAMRVMRLFEGGRRFLVSLGRGTNERKQDEALLDGQKRILELIIQGEPLPRVLTALCRTIEELTQEEMLASVLLLDADGIHLRHGAAPSLPDDYVRAVDGIAIGPSVGSCGTAAYRGKPVYVTDIASDPLWVPYAELALSHGLRACWSSPILSSTAEVLGTFAMYYRQPRHPTPRDLRAVDIVTRTVAIAIERNRADLALRKSEERFRSTFENAAVGMAHTDVQGRFLRVNEKYCDIVGYSSEELYGKTFQEITHADDLAATTELFALLIEGQSAGYGLEKRYVRKDGSPVWVELFVSLQRDAAGKPAYAIAVVQDISERKRLEGELWRAKDLAEAANRAKDEFLANVSHEIRTPMNAILGMTELALDTSLTDHQRQCLQTVKSAADNLLVIINDLLDFAKIEAGKMELTPAPFSLRAAVSDTLRALALRAHKKHLELIHEVASDVPDALIGDAGRLRQVLLNLVGNAIKFTDAGKVEVRVEQASRGAVSQVSYPISGVAASGVAASEFAADLRFIVRDTGIGIPRDHQGRIFRAFEQQDTSTTRKYEGTGLGLTIAARLVALMGGTITVDSEPGRGSTFAFTAHLARQAAPQTGAKTEHENQATKERWASFAVRRSSLSRRVLVAEDNEFNAQLLQQLLVRQGHDVCLASDGREALKLLDDNPFDIMLLDVHMPELDGFEVANEVRRRERTTRAHLPIIALTARSRKEDRERCLAAGMDDFLAKPIQATDLWTTMDRAFSKNEKAREIKDEIGMGYESATSAGTKLIDAKVLLAACGGDAVILQALCQTLRARLPDHLKAIRDALQAHDSGRLREAAHKLTSMIAAFSTVAGNVASNLEDRAAEGRLEEAEPLVQQLESMAQALMATAENISVKMLQGPVRDSAKKAEG
jgi:PAS domain S-box-containing protein